MITAGDKFDPSKPIKTHNERIEKEIGNIVGRNCKTNGTVREVIDIAGLVIEIVEYIENEIDSHRRLPRKE